MNICSDSNLPDEDAGAVKGTAAVVASVGVGNTAAAAAAADSTGSADTGECASPAIDPEAVAKARASLADERSIWRTTSIFSALADPTRFSILDALVSCELCVCDLAEIAGVSQSGVSHQLRLLRDRGLVAFRREGNRAIYRLADGHVKDLILHSFTV